jgi:hypothetical protein
MRMECELVLTSLEDCSKIECYFRFHWLKGGRNAEREVSKLVSSTREGLTGDAPAPGLVEELG